MELFRDWPESIVAPGPHFVLFVAGDASSADESDLREFARKLIGQGAAYLAAWGPEAGRVESSFDDADIDLHPDPDDYLLTVSATDEALDEALWDVLFVASPSPRYEHSCTSLLAITVGNDEWAATIERRLAAPDELERDLGLDE